MIVGDHRMRAKWPLPDRYSLTSCPISGRKLEHVASGWYSKRVREDTLEDLIDHVASTTSLERGEAARVVAEVMAYFAEDAVSFVRRRHAELKERGFKNNDEIFTEIQEELVARRFSAQQMSVRQLRRLVYG